MTELWSEDPRTALRVGADFDLSTFDRGGAPAWTGTKDQAEAAMRFMLKRRDGTEVWSGIVGGAASRFGRSLTAENYNEVLSDAVFSCFSKLWVDPGFREAWAGKRNVQASQPAGVVAKATCLC
mgnify:CR=1 FL=1